MAGSFISGRIGASRSIEFMTMLGGVIGVANGALLAGWLYFGGVSMAALYIPGMLVSLAQGLSMPYAQAGAMAVDTELAGSASGAVVFSQFFWPAALQQLTGLLSDGTWVPMAAGTMRAATAAAEPDEEPPGVRAGSNGFVVGPGWLPPSSAVTVLPRITAPACRSAHTAALSRRGKWPRYAAQPISVGMSFVSSRSLMPMGSPSMADSGRPAFQRAVLASAAARAPGWFRATNACTTGSRSAMVARHRSR